MLHQAAYLLGGEITAIVSCDEKSNFLDIYKITEDLLKQGKKFIFYDEITALQEFPIVAEYISEIAEKNPIKIILSGTNSLAFWLASNDVLYERCTFFSTTYMPYSEWQYLADSSQKQCTFDRYIQEGGVFKKLSLQTARVPKVAQTSLLDEYEYTAIARNIQNSLFMNWHEPKYDLLEELYYNDKLTHAIMHVVHNESHTFLSNILSYAMKKYDLSSALGLLSNKENINFDAAYTILAKKLGMFPSHIVPKLDDTQVELLSLYLKDIDFYSTIPQYIIKNDTIQKSNENIISQPGIRYAQIEAVIDTILNQVSMNVDEQKSFKNAVYSRLVGTYFEEYIRFDLYTNFSGNEVFKLKYLGNQGKFDVLLYNPEQHCVDIFEIKHGAKEKNEWYKNFRNINFLQMIKKNYGKIKSMSILYEGENIRNKRVQLLNIEDFFKDNFDKPEQIHNITPTFSSFQNTQVTQSSHNNEVIWKM